MHWFSTTPTTPHLQKTYRNSSGDKLQPSFGIGRGLQVFEHALGQLEEDCRLGDMVMGVHVVDGTVQRDAASIGGSHGVEQCIEKEDVVHGSFSSRQYPSCLKEAMCCLLPISQS